MGRRPCLEEEAAHRGGDGSCSLCVFPIRLVHGDRARGAPGAMRLLRDLWGRGAACQPGHQGLTGLLPAGPRQTCREKYETNVEEEGERRAGHGGGVGVPGA